MATKTVILLDHREGLLAKTDQTVAIDELSADKSKWTVIMEAAVEYTRILLDVCSSLHPVCCLTETFFFAHCFQNFIIDRNL